MRPTLLFLAVFLLNLGILINGQGYNSAFPNANAIPQQATQYPQQTQGFAPPTQDTYSTTETHDHVWLKPGEDFKEPDLSDFKDKEDLEPMEKDKFKDIEEIEDKKKHDKKHEKDDDKDINEDDGSGESEDSEKSSDKASSKHDKGKQDDRVNMRFLPLMRIPLYLNKPFYPWMKHSYCFHPVCHVPGMRNGFKGWQKKFLAAYVVIHDIMYLAYRC